MRLTRRATALALASGGPATVARARAAWSPTQPVRVIIPFTPGGTMDPVARLAQAPLQQDLGQPVVLDHKPGGSTIIGTQEVARAAPDGHTLLLMANSFAGNITLRPSMPCDSLRDFAPVA